MWANKKWVDWQMLQGEKYVDIGAPDEAIRPPINKPLGASKYADAEQNALRDFGRDGYPNYVQDPQLGWNLHPTSLGDDMPRMSDDN